jgi:dTDP-4-dehydrorhamnose reductase
MRWAVLGSRGMLGSELIEMLSDLDYDAVGFTRGSLDFGSSASLNNALKDFDVIVNCIAYTNVDLAESEPEAARFANVEIPKRLVAELGSTDARLLHISTDYVFSGVLSEPYRVDDAKAPLGLYGRTKSEGEDVWLAGSDNSQVIRTAWLYGSYGNCFPKTIAQKLLDGEQLNVVDDQTGSPTWTWDLARFIVEVGLNPNSSRILHGVSSGATTWYGFADGIAENLDEFVPERRLEGVTSFRDLITPTVTERYPTPAKRPRSSVLEPSVIGDFQIPDWKTSWQTAATIVLEDLLRESDHNSR